MIRESLPVFVDDCWTGLGALELTVILVIWCSWLFFDDCRPVPDRPSTKVSAFAASCGEWSSEGTRNGRREMFWRTPEGDGKRTARSAKRKKAVINRSVFASSAAPRGWVGRRAMGGAGGQGMRPRSILSRQRSSAGWREGCRRDWRGRCHHRARGW